jgi:tetratricopeptide (TPR) repeat protein
VVKTKSKDQADEAAKAAAAAKATAGDFNSVIDQVAKVVRPYLKPIGIGAGALLVAIVAWNVWTGAQAKKAGHATAELGKVLDTATARVDEGGPDIEALASGQPPEPARFKTFKDRSEAELAASQALDVTFGGSKAAARAKLVAAGALYDLGKHDEAIAAYRAFIASGPGVDLAAVAKEGVGYCIEAKALAQTDAAARTAGLGEALAAYAAIAADDKDPHYATSLYHQARIKALQGDKAGAVDLYKKVLDKNPGGVLTEEVNGRLALLDAAPGPAAAPAPAPAPAAGK